MDTIVILLALFLAIFGVFYLHYTTRNRERLALIEKGADASLFRLGREQKQKSSIFSVFSVLKVGLFLIGGGTGVAAGFLLGEAGMDPGASYPSMILLFAGLGLVAYYLVFRRSEKG